MASARTFTDRMIHHILVVEDNLATQRFVVSALSVFPDAKVQCTASLADAERLAKRVTFDLAVVDLGLPDGSGNVLIRWFSEMSPATLCIAYTMFDDDTTLFGALSAGAQGYLLKGQPEEELQDRLMTAVRGEPVVSPSIARKVLQYFRTSVAPAEPQKSDFVASRPLTEREADALALIGSGLTVAEAAAELGVSQNTIKTHVKAAYSKLNIKTRAAAAIEAQRLGLIALPRLR